MRSPSLCVCPQHQLLNQLAHFHEMRYGGHATEGDLDAILFNPVASTIPKWWMFKLLRWMQNVHQSMWDHGILYSDRPSEDEQLLLRPLLWKTKNTNMAGGWNLKFTLGFMETTHEPLHLRQIKFGTVKDVPKSIIWIIILFDKAFKLGNGATFWGYVGTNAESLRAEFYNSL
jgi:hypothetical protein